MLKSWHNRKRWAERWESIDAARTERAEEDVRWLALGPLDSLRARGLNIRRQMREAREALLTVSA